MVEKILKSGVNINHQCQNDFTALMHAVRLSKIDAIKILLQYGANTDLQNPDGFTALIDACIVENSNPEIVKLLLDAGANVHIRTNSGGTAIKYAQTEEIIQMLLNAGADPQQIDKNGRYASRVCTFH
jgi:ankyrin repeat protein